MVIEYPTPVIRAPESVYQSEAPKLLMNHEGLCQYRAPLQTEILVSLALLAAPKRKPLV